MNVDLHKDAKSVNAADNSTVTKNISDTPEIQNSNLPKQVRPKKFKDVIGQNLAVKLIHNGLKKGLLGNVCLLYGPAGVGKTTLARLIAQWFACERIPNKTFQNNEDIEPCGECKGCIDCINGSHPDIFELDGASNTSVESIRNLLDGVGYKPIIAKKKTYIIDEVHMLSRSAISALLKTLEEPHEHMQFVLATTDLIKIPRTIVSRCFRVSLESIKREDIILHLKNLSHKLNIKITDEALDMIFLASYGSMRQAIATLEQASLLFAEITGVGLEQMLGLTSSNTIDTLLNHIKSNDMKNIKAMVQKMNEQGSDPLILVRQMLAKLRSQDDISSQDISLGYMFVQASLELHQSPYPNEILDICLLKAAMMYNIAPLNNVDNIANTDSSSSQSGNVQNRDDMKNTVEKDMQHGTKLANNAKNGNDSTLQSDNKMSQDSNAEKDSLRKFAHDIFKT